MKITSIAFPQTKLKTVLCSDATGVRSEQRVNHKKNKGWSRFLGNCVVEPLKKCRIVSGNLPGLSNGVEKDSITTASLGAISTIALGNSDFIPSSRSNVLFDAKVERSWVSLIHVYDCLLNYWHLVSFALNNKL